MLPLLGQRDSLAHCPPGPKILANFVAGGAEARGGLKAPEPAHRIVAPLDASVILLQSIIEIAIAAMDDLPAERPSNRAG